LSWVEVNTTQLRMRNRRVRLNLHLIEGPTAEGNESAAQRESDEALLQSDPQEPGDHDTFLASPLSSIAPSTTTRSPACTPFKSGTTSPLRLPTVTSVC